VHDTPATALCGSSLRSAELAGGLQGMIGQAIRFLIRGHGRGAPHALCAVAGMWLAQAAPARAEFEVCNQTLDALNLAIAQANPDGVFVTQGWWIIGANHCANVIREELANQYIYVYATDVFGQPILPAEVQGYDMCVGPKGFEISGTDSCWQRGYMKVHFMEVDTKQQVRWTLYLKEPDPG
jgi:uncharacterized membrane protein